MIVVNPNETTHTISVVSRFDMKEYVESVRDFIERVKDDAGTSESFSYIYTKLDENTGTLDMTDYYIYDYAGDPWHGQNIKDVGQVKLTWSSDEDATFYNGNWSDVQGVGAYTNLDTGEERVSTSSPSSGTFGVVSNVSIYIEQSKQTASTGN